jgi:hypothetical protein
MRLSDRNFALALAFGVALALAGCNPAALMPGDLGSDGGGTIGSGPTGQLKIRITDAPAPVDYIDEAWVTITRIDVLRCPDVSDGGDPNAAEPNDPNSVDDPNDPNQPGDPNGLDDDDEGDHDQGDDVDDDDDDDGEHHAERPWITVFDDPNGVPFDLMTLRNGRLADLIDAELPAGSYKQIRVFVDGGRVVLSDGREFPLHVPSGDSSGIKLRLKFEIVEGADTEMLLDFDLSRVFRPVPGGAFEHAREVRGFMFRPSLGLRVADLGESGSLGGEAQDDQGAVHGGVEVVAYRGHTRVATTYTEADGSFAFVGLDPGNYRIAFAGGDGFEPREVRTQVKRGKHTNNANSRSGQHMDAEGG